MTPSIIILTVLFLLYPDISFGLYCNASARCADWISSLPDKLPSGTVTFPFTDIEDSTRLWQEQPEAMARAHALHDQILYEAIQANHGYVFQIVGDSFSVAFHHAHDALMATLNAQRELQTRQKIRRSKLRFAWDCTLAQPKYFPLGNISAVPQSLLLNV